MNLGSEIRPIFVRMLLINKNLNTKDRKLAVLVFELS